MHSRSLHRRATRSETSLNARTLCAQKHGRIGFPTTPTSSSRSLPDPRIVSPDLSVSIVMAAKTLLGEPAYMHHIETCETRCEILVKAWLRCYEGRYWVPSTDILVRFWAGEGYMFEACHVAIDGAASAAAAHCHGLLRTRLARSVESSAGSAQHHQTF